MHWTVDTFNWVIKYAIQTELPLLNAKIPPLEFG